MNELVFDGRFAGMPVYLDLEGALSAAIGQHASTGDPSAAISAASAATLDLSSSNPFDWQNQMHIRWSKGDRVSGPPFTALLCSLTAAAVHMHQDAEHSSHNYYERLFETWRIRNLTHQQKIKLHFRDTKLYWEALNKWLAEWSFDLGRPTAAQINGFKYVSYAVSQALIRDAERQKLREMFSESSLAPGERLSASEMELYLRAWLRRGQASSYLNRVWNKPDLRQRLIDVACLELETWDGTRKGTEGQQIQSVRSFQWAASISRFPRARIQLHLTVPKGDGSAAGNLASPTGVSCLAFGGRAPQLRLAELPGEDLLALAPVDPQNIGSLLESDFELNKAGAGLLFRRISRHIIPMMRHQKGTLFREVSRVALLQPHLILCKEQWRLRVEEHLKQVAKAGFKPLGNGALQGLPSGWIAFTGVEIVAKPLGRPSNDLLDLVPLAESTIAVQQGFHLFDDEWHADAPIEIEAVTEEPPVTIELRGNDDGRPLATSDNAKGTACRLNVPEGARQPGSAVGAVLINDGQELRRLRLVFQSGEAPRPLGLASVPDIAYSLGTSNSFGLISARAESAQAQSVRGMLAINDVSGVTLCEASVSREPELDGFEEEQDAVLESQGLEQPRTAGISCVARGHHHWLVEPFNRGDNRRDAKWMKCKGCSLQNLSRGDGANARAVREEPPQRQERKQISADLLFDGLCFLGGGRWPRLQEICIQGSDEPWFAAKFGNQLAALGHIDIQLHESTLRPLYWRCSPPTAVQTETSFFLAGFRSARLLRDITNMVEAAGGRVTTREQIDAPTAYLFSDISRAEFAEVVSGIKDPHGRAIAIVGSPAHSILAGCPALSQLYEDLPETYFASSDAIERFDPSKGRWIRVDDNTMPGGYRCSSAGMSYAVRTRSGALRTADYRIAKIYAASLAQLSLHGYRQGEREFTAVLGCEPPVLIDRLLVACSGLLPARRGKRLHYQNIPPDVGGSVLNLLYG